MTSRGGWLGLITLAGSVVMAGCAAEAEDSRGVRLMPDAHPFEPDIPLPAGFRLVDQASEDRLSGSRRLYLRHVYEGKADKHAVRSFYREEMPLSRWGLVSDGNIKGNFSMRFEKGSQTCTIQITDRPGVFSTRVRIQVIVAHEERGQVPPTARKSS